MKLYLDSCNLNEIKKINELGIISGVTSTPSFAMKEKIPYDAILIKKIRRIMGEEKEIYYTIASTDYDEIMNVANDMFEESNRDKKLIMKLSLSDNAIKASKKLKNEGIRTGMHLIHSLNQAMLASKSEAECLFPLVGRSDDIGIEGIVMISEIKEAFKNNDIEINIIGASIRHPTHVSELFKMGVYGIAIPPSIYSKLIPHPLTEKGITEFRKDYIKSKMYI